MKKLLLTFACLLYFSEAFTQKLEWVIEPKKRAFTKYYYYPDMDMVLLYEPEEFQFFTKDGKQKKFGSFDKTRTLFFSYFGERALVVTNKKLGLIDKEGKLLGGKRYERLAINDNTHYDNSKYVTASLDGVHWGAIDKDGNEVIPFKFGRINNLTGFSKGPVHIKNLDLISVENGNSRNVVMDLNGTQLLPEGEYPAEMTFLKNYTLIRNSARGGYQHYRYNNATKKIDQLPYEWIYEQYGHTIYKKDKKRGFLDQELNPIPGLYDDILAENGVLLYKENGELGILDAQLKPASKMIIDSVDNLSAMKIGSGWEVTDSKNNAITKGSYSFIFPFQKNGLALFHKPELSKNKEQFGFLNKAGKEVVTSTSFDSISVNGFINNRLLFKDKGLYGVLDTSGKIVVPAMYDEIQEGSFGKNLIWYTKNKMNGVLDLNGKEIIPPVYEIVLPYSDSLFLTKRFDKMSMLGKNGKEIVPLQYDYINPKHKNFRFAFRKGNTAGVMDQNGKIIFSMENVIIEMITYDLMEVSKYKPSKISDGPLGVFAGEAAAARGMESMIGTDFSVGVAKVPENNK